MTQLHKKDIRDGLHDSIAIALGYFAVAVSLGIAGRGAGLTAFQGFLASWTTLASAGEFAGFNVIQEQAVYAEMAIITLIINARYILMSASLSQKIPEGTPLVHRLLIAWGVTDEIFGVSIARSVPITVYYSLSVIIPGAIGWSAGTALGIVMGNVLPARLVMALGVSLYGMFMAVFIPEARKSKVVAGVVAASFALSWVFTKVSPLSKLSSGNRVIILTLVIAGAAALLFPVKDETAEDKDAASKETEAAK